jgi:hypothetical protein
MTATISNGFEEVATMVRTGCLALPLILAPVWPLRNPRFSGTPPGSSIPIRS